MTGIFRKRGGMGAVLALLFLTISPSALRAAGSYVAANFDDVPGNAFSFKDDKGSQLTGTTRQADAARKNVLYLQYHIVKGGWGGWGLGLGGANVQQYGTLTFMARSEDGTPKFQVGLKDQSGQEKKLDIGPYADIGPEWRKVRVPLKDFAGVNLSAIDNFTFGFSDASEKGSVYVDDIQFEGPASQGQQGSSPSSADKVLLDGFERSNPNDLYLVYEADDSSLQLIGSRIAKEGDYAMELQYLLSTQRLTGSWVAAQWQAKTNALDWRGVQQVKLWVKGDGSGNIFRFVIRDADGERWAYENSEILKSTRWEQLVMPISDFALEAKDGTGNHALDLQEIRSYAIMVQGVGGSNVTPGVKTTEGHIQVDELYLVGQNINPVWAVPQAAAATQEKVKLARIGNIDFNGQLFTEYLYTPEQQNRVTHFAKIIANGKVGNYSARVELGSEAQEFGDSAYFDASQSTTVGSTAVNKFPQGTFQNIQGFANNLSPYLTLVTVGNQFIDYSPYTFSPVFGFKGLSAEGDYDLLNYHGFVLKHKYDSYTAGARLKAYWEGIRLTGIGVYWRETALVTNTANGPAVSQTNGTVQVNSQVQQLAEVQNDLVYTLDGERTFLDDRVLVGGTLGYNRYNQLAQADRTDPANPIYGGALANPLAVQGTMGRARLGLTEGIPGTAFAIPGFRVNYEYRNVGIEFKPHYRQNPIVFDDLESDQRGHNLRFSEAYQGFNGSFEYDTMVRNSNSDFFRHRFSWSVGYYGFDKVDIAFNQISRREIYQFVSDRTGVSIIHNEKQTDSEIYIRAQVNPQFAVIFRPGRQDVVQTDTGLAFSNESLFGRAEYLPIPNLKIAGEFKSTYFGQGKAFEPQGNPFFDNYLKGSIEFDF